MDSPDEKQTHSVTVSSSMTMREDKPCTIRTETKTTETNTTETSEMAPLSTSSIDSCLPFVQSPMSARSPFSAPLCISPESSNPVVLSTIKPIALVSPHRIVHHPSKLTYFD